VVCDVEPHVAQHDIIGTSRCGRGFAYSPDTALAKCSGAVERLKTVEANALNYEIQIMGIVDDGFTSAEISEEGADSPGRVFDLEQGWYVECGQLERLRKPELLDAVLRARDELLHFVNRKGGEPPPDTSRTE
jgi:hypothetical protein